MDTCNSHDIAFKSGNCPMCDMESDYQQQIKELESDVTHLENELGRVEEELEAVSNG